MSKPDPCHCCHGSGQERDDAVIGRSLSGLRLRAGVSLREQARRMGISHPYLCQLEKGRRAWSVRLMEKYRGSLP